MAYPFIVLEGIDGCGKGEQARELERAIRKKRQPFVLHKYPTDAAQGVRRHLEGKGSLDADALFAAFVDDLQSRQAQLEQDRQKAWVVADRYCISTAAYQGAGGRLEERISQLEKYEWVKPDLVLWLDLPVEEAMKRKAAQKSPDRHEADRAFLEDVRTNFDALYRRKFLCSKYVRVDASQTPSRVAADIRAAIEQ
ncbi:Thymidylate kinase [uncultured archaeon]|nr:Thymidylate kinase [uncultured archaeon]